MEFIYTGKVLSFDTTTSSSSDDRYNKYYDTVKSILITANPFGVMELKLYIEGCWITATCRFTFMWTIERSVYKSVYDRL